MGAIAPAAPRRDAGDDSPPPEKPRVVRLLGHTIYLGRFNGRGFAVMAEAFWGHAPVSVLLLFAGLLGALVRRRNARETRLAGPRSSDVWIAATFVGPTLLVFGLYEMSNHRFFLPLVPFLCVGAAFGLRAVVRSLDRFRPRVSTAIAAAAIGLTLAFPAFAAAKLTHLRASKDTAESAADWIEEHVSRVADVLVVGLPSLPLPQRLDLFTRDDTWSRTAWERYQYRSPDSRAAARHAGYALHYPDVDRRRLLGARRSWGMTWLKQTVSADRPDVVVCAALDESEWTKRQRALFTAAGGRLASRISSSDPRRRSIDTPYWLGPTATRDVLRATALGPPLEIWVFE